MPVPSYNKQSCTCALHGVKQVGKFCWYWYESVEWTFSNENIGIGIVSNCSMKMQEENLEKKIRFWKCFNNKKQNVSVGAKETHWNQNEDFFTVCFIFFPSISFLIGLCRLPLHRWLKRNYTTKTDSKPWIFSISLKYFIWPHLIPFYSFIRT